jgi:hypothetical protein
LEALDNKSNSISVDAVGVLARFREQAQAE